MKKSNHWKLVYLPVFAVYFSFPIIRDVIPGYEYYEMDDWLTLAGLYLIGIVVALPVLLLLKMTAIERFKSSTWRYVGALLMTAMQIAVLISFWHQSNYLYISSAIMMGVSCVIIGIGIQKVELFKDQSTGAFYRVADGKKYPISEDELERYRSKFADGRAPIVQILSDSSNGSDSNFSVFPLSSVSDGSASNDYNTGMAINPSSGMPMVGGISGMDVHGNSWGTNFNEPSNTYDPNRGY
ncbi:hypothetical protein [Leclercia adecarboxylata]|uniref:hypothetical protein n=1 Tax=Leclercia adecarboxylata TaxID=83655 RepID=UPI00254C30A7|nr:hypothetical protein [Leclercia adecarboxylata]